MLSNPYLGGFGTRLQVEVQSKLFELGRSILCKILIVALSFVLYLKYDRLIVESRDLKKACVL